MSSFINNYYYGKAGKADFTEDDMPTYCNGVHTAGGLVGDGTAGAYNPSAAYDSGETYAGGSSSYSGSDSGTSSGSASGADSGSASGADSAASAADSGTPSAADSGTPSAVDSAASVVEVPPEG